MSNFKIINNEVVNLYEKPSFKSQIVTQGLLWENVEICDEKENWYKIRQWDNYQSYILKNNLIDSDVYFKYSLDDDKKWFFVKNRIIEINNLKNNFSKILSFGTLIPIIEKKEKYYMTIMPDGNKFFINKNTLTEYSKKNNFNNIIKYALKNLGCPYLWGGKSGFGYDCSGFIQTLYRFNKINLPRDTKDQIKSNLLTEVVGDFKKGDLIYFHVDSVVNHVGMFIDEFQYIHSSVNVKINSINKNFDNYNNDLYNNILGVFRIKDA